jgi:hypothetical protein
MSIAGLEISSECCPKIEIKLIRLNNLKITVGAVETGSYRYEVYDTSSTVGAAVAVVETGLAYVQVISLTFNTFANTIQYNVYGASAVSIFDSTFDQTFQ